MADQIIYVSPRTRIPTAVKSILARESAFEDDMRESNSDIFLTIFVFTVLYKLNVELSHSIWIFSNKP